jgi:lipopolysaccharide transport system ATP-binding protein
MTQASITVEGLGKRYRLGRVARRHDTLRDLVTGTIKAAAYRLRNPGAGGAESDDFWALKDVSFEVGQGEVVGIIGRNGAGKSTMLKVLSRIAAPTEGRVRIRGRLASLLEVGTGFHPELTGRENISLNGSILGMKKVEIDTKFDEIVAFAEVERFLDTQVKFYSSGMYVRLAFAVAAHLEPRILVIDEVLAVGDAAFQRKCLGKMQQVAGQGRTVLFVSHNMPTVIQLCQRAILMKSGSLVMDGQPEDVVHRYYAEGIDEAQAVRDLSTVRRSTPSNGGCQFTSCRLVEPGPSGPWTLSFGRPLEVEVGLLVHRRLADIVIGAPLLNSSGTEFASPVSSDSGPKLTLEPGQYTIRFSFPTLRLITGRYGFDLGIRSDRGMEDHLVEAGFFEVLPNTESSDALVHQRRGAIVPDFHVEVSRS